MTMKTNKVLFYFGCIRDKGHYLWTSDSDNNWYARQVAQTIPGLNYHVLEVMDGTFAPSGIGEEQGLYQESLVPPVRIVAWWDRSVDKRGACNSALIGYGYDSAEEMLDDAVVKFPSVMSRQPRPVPNTV